MKPTVSDLNMSQLLTLQKLIDEKEKDIKKRIRHIKRLGISSFITFCLECVLFGAYLKFENRIDGLVLLALVILFFANFYIIASKSNCTKALDDVSELRQLIKNRMNFIKYN